MMRSAFSPPASGPTSLPNPATRQPSRITVGGDACGAPECAGEMVVV